jgi:hypothetical protein
MPAESLFTWEFRATSGDAWGGTLAAAAGAFRPGETRSAAAGAYTILAEGGPGFELGAFGLAPGMLFVEWYWDSASRAFLPTRNGPGAASGTAGLGSEVDAAWDGSAWVTFGREGLDQVDGPSAVGGVATTRHAWVFEALSGDRWQGDLFATDGAFAAGQVVAVPLGRYRIEASAALPSGAFVAAGTVEVRGSYFDSATGAWLPVQQPGGLAGADGFGSEFGLVQFGGGLAAFGRGGALQVGEAADVRHFPFALGSPGFGIQSSGSRIELSDGTRLSGFGVQLVFTDGRMGNRDGDPLFDGIFYAATYRDIFAAQVPARGHYMEFGWREGRDPNAFFSSFGYLASSGDVRAAGLNPLEHYRAFGWREGRDPSWNFDTQFYLARNRDVAAAGLDPLAHFIAFGAAEGRPTSPAVGRTVNEGFDIEFYRLRYPDIGFAGVNAEAHFRTLGWREGRDPNAWFDTAGYLAAYADVRAAGLDPLMHYMTFGWREGRDPTARFDTEQYLVRNPDVAAAGLQPLAHFLQFGLLEGRGAQGDGIWG